MKGFKSNKSLFTPEYGNMEDNADIIIDSNNQSSSISIPKEAYLSDIIEIENEFDNSSIDIKNNHSFMPTQSDLAFQMLGKTKPTYSKKRKRRKKK